MLHCFRQIFTCGENWFLATTIRARVIALASPRGEKFKLTRAPSRPLNWEKCVNRPRAGVFTHIRVPEQKADSRERRRRRRLAWAAAAAATEQPTSASGAPRTEGYILLLHRGRYTFPLPAYNRFIRPNAHLSTYPVSLNRIANELRDSTRDAAYLWMLAREVLFFRWIYIELVGLFFFLCRV